LSERTKRDQFAERAFTEIGAYAGVHAPAWWFLAVLRARTGIMIEAVIAELVLLLHAA
jgi:hypothetical protein